MSNVALVPTPANEPVRDYRPGSAPRATLQAELQRQLADRLEIPAIIGGREVRTGRLQQVTCPHDHRHVLAEAHLGATNETQAAIAAAQEAWPGWSSMPFASRAAVFLRAAELLSGPWRDRVNAATMLGQSKTCVQAELDSACELIDFWRFNPLFAQELFRQQSRNAPGVWNFADYRPLEGFVFAVTPFNFTAIGGNLPTAPALMGNTVVWKPATSSLLSNYLTMKLLQAAGLPDGVINFVPGRGGDVGDPALADTRLAGVHFTGSTGTFHRLWRTIGNHIADYASYPRIVGETGGKDFVFAHASADVEGLVTALLRGAFEYQGQKCSAASRVYLPRSLWPRVRTELVERIGEIAMGTPVDFRNFMAAVIDRPSFTRIASFLEEARGNGYEILAGGVADEAEGYFVQPTLVLSEDPKSRLMREEIFGPLLTIFVYEDASFEETLALCDATSPYALTGAIFANDRRVIERMSERLRFAAGNFYINDKPTGAVVGQQPFGGGRASGTNDKAGSSLNLSRWMSMRAIKETLVPATSYRYPHMEESRCE